MSVIIEAEIMTILRIIIQFSKQQEREVGVSHLFMSKFFRGLLTRSFSINLIFSSKKWLKLNNVLAEWRVV